MDINKLSEIAKALVAPKKGLLAADESFPTIEKRFKAIRIDSTEETRRSYREMLFTTHGIEEFLSGIILFDETIHQNATDGISFVELLQKKGIIPGIKVDEGTEVMADSPNEKVTKGLEGLPARLPEYFKIGVRFVKWRAVIVIGNGIPTDACIVENATRLAQYARLCQENGLVPMLEPEILMDGEHTIEQCQEATERTLTAVFQTVAEKGVVNSGLLLKTN